MKFFKPEDFEMGQPDNLNVITRILISSIANDKLEREGQLVHAVECGKDFGAWTTHKSKFDTHMALLINIEPLTLPKCEHQKHKVSCKGWLPEEKEYWFQCECGKDVVANKFEEVK